MSDTHKPKTIVCEEVFDEFSAPSEEGEFFKSILSYYCVC